MTVTAGELQEAGVNLSTTECDKVQLWYGKHPGTQQEFYSDYDFGNSCEIFPAAFFSPKIYQMNV